MLVPHQTKYYQIVKQFAENIRIHHLQKCFHSFLFCNFLASLDLNFLNQLWMMSLILAKN